LPSPTDTPIPSPTATPEQTSTALPQAGLSGRILDQETGQPIARAQVRVGSETTTTDAEGRYTLTGLPPGQYILSVTHESYDPGLSAIFTLAAEQELAVDLPLYAPDTSPYPQDPMLTNPLDPNGAPTQADAERLAREQGLTGEVVSIKETKLRGEYLVNYKRNDNVRAAVAELNHDAWELTDETGRKWWIIKVCGNLASLLPQEAPIATPVPCPLPPLAEVLVDGLVVRTCAADGCGEVGTVSRGEQVEVFGCLADGGWCEVGWPGGRGWCTGKSLKQLAVAEVVPVVETVLPTSTPAVPSDGGKIVFVSLRDGNAEIYVMNANGSGLSRLTNHPAQDLCPAWSPDGHRIAFTSDRDGNQDVYVMNADGDGLSRLTNHPAQDLCPAWSPDGHRIAFTSDRDGNQEVYVMNADGKDLARLTDHSDTRDGEPDWSPDGQRIVFASWAEVPEGFRASGYMIPGIDVINTDGTGRTSLGVGVDPAWSPDGQQIVFNGLHSLIFSADLEWGIDVVNADGKSYTNLTVGLNVGSGASPAWSPDGRKITFVSEHDGSSAIYVMNADGNGLMRLAEGLSPDWSR
jgi:TolB protein